MKKRPQHQPLAREHADPLERNRPVPRVVLLAAMVLLVWAVAYIATTQSDDAPELGDQRSVASLTGTASAAGGADGAQLFAANCVACHQATGLGLAGVFPPLAGSEWVLAKAPVLVNIVLHGITGQLTVQGQLYNGQMPSFKDKLNDAEIAAVLSFVRSSFGNTAGKVAPEQVREQREASTSRQTPWGGDAELNALRR